MRSGLEGERLLVDHLFPGYRAMLDDPAAPQSSARVLLDLRQYARVLEMEGAQSWGPVAYALRVYPAAKRFLRARGRSAEEIERMPALQAVFLYEIHHYDVAYDDLRKWASLPYADAAPQLRRVIERAKRGASPSDRSTLPALLLPALGKVFAASARIDRKVAALRCVEALRLHAASKGGKLPATLDEVTEVPVPLDPWTGKAFEYKREGDKAVLTGPVAPDDEPRNAVRYELTLRAAKEKN
jgi:hypothetical protein